MRPTERASLSNCPVTPLGTCEDWLFFVDALGQHRAIQAGQLSRNTIFALFGGRSEYLLAHWPPAMGSEWNHVKAAEALIAAALEKGIVDPQRLGFSTSFGAAAPTSEP